MREGVSLGIPCEFSDAFHCCLVFGGEFLVCFLEFLSLVSEVCGNLTGEVAGFRTTERAD